MHTWFYAWSIKSMVRRWEPLLTCSKNSSKNNVKVVWYWNKFLRLHHQPNFKIILLKRLKQLLTKLIWPFPKNGQTNLEIRVILILRASNKGPDVLTIFQCWTEGQSSTAIAKDLRPTAKKLFWHMFTFFYPTALAIAYRQRPKVKILPTV